MVHGRAAGRLAAVAPDQGDGQHAELGRGLQPALDRRVVAVHRHPEGDVVGGAQVAELVGVDLGVALAAGDAGQGGHVAGQGDGRQGPLPTITGCTNSTAMCWASVLGPPLPKQTSLPPRWKRTAMAWQAAATWAASSARASTGLTRWSRASVAAAWSVSDSRCRMLGPPGGLPASRKHAPLLTALQDTSVRTAYGRSVTFDWFLGPGRHLPYNRTNWRRRGSDPWRSALATPGQTGCPTTAATPGIPKSRWSSTRSSWSPRRSRPGPPRSPTSASSCCATCATPR